MWVPTLDRLVATSRGLIDQEPSALGIEGEYQGVVFAPDVERGVVTFDPCVCELWSVGWDRRCVSWTLM